MRRRGLLTGYIKVPELSKNMKQHVHVLFRGKYIEQALISAWWEEIHHAKVVDIRKVYYHHSPKRIASYMAKYMSKENTYRYSWNWGWVWRGFVKDWTRLKSSFYKYYGSFSREISLRLVSFWSRWLKGTWQPDWELIEILLPLQPKRR
ncbi:unnamed protein product [marine sediment metagenome]|uniref:Uncharacterized protein n=1 Tax=marine sediment metagenome TaxID=412755 RepID=X1EDS6_9ZZZZ